MQAIKRTPGESLSTSTEKAPNPVLTRKRKAGMEVSSADPSGHQPSGLRFWAELRRITHSAPTLLQTNDFRGQLEGGGLNGAGFGGAVEHGPLCP